MSQIQRWDLPQMEVHIFVAYKRSLWRLCFHRCLSVHRGSLSRGVWSQSGGSVSRGYLSRGSLSSGVSVQGGVTVQWRSLSRGSLSRGVSVQGGLSGDPPYSKERTVRILLECIFVINKKVHISFQLQIRRTSVYWDCVRKIPFISQIWIFSLYWDTNKGTFYLNGN